MNTLQRRKLASAVLLSWVVVCLLAGSRVSGASRSSSTADARPPNILFILTDDQRFDSLGCAGNPVIQTPHLDRLAARGMRFRQHFVTTSICSVSRASIFTGQYLRRHGIGDFATPLSAAQWAETYPALLRSAGYRTGFIGKFGVGNAASMRSKTNDFDFWRGLPGQAGEWFIDPNDSSQQHATAKFGDQALDFLESCRPDQPFCLSISFNAPHARDGKPREFQPDPRDEPLYTESLLPVAPSADLAAFERLPEFVQTSEARRRWERRFATEEMRQNTVRDYYRLITGIDREVGRLVRRLEELGMDRNTVILFTSDNGFFLGEHGLADKWFMHEESIRTPLIIFDPRQPARLRGRTVNAMTLNVDLAPTMIEMAGLAMPGAMQGRSLVPWLRGRRPADWRTEFFYEHHFGPNIIPPSEGLRTGRYAYWRWLTPNREIEELYDLTRDPWQLRNLAAEPSSRNILKTMRIALERRREEAR